MTKPPCVLIVEDEVDLVEIMTDRLAEEKIRAVSASGKVSVAFKMLMNQKFDCIVVDIQLAQGTGDQLIAQIRRDGRGLNHRTPILVTSSHLDITLMQQLRGQIHGALTKPFERQLFAAKVRELCKWDPQQLDAA